MRRNKENIIAPIVLLVIFLPCTIIGIINHFKDPNKNHDVYFEGELYFYNKDDELLGKYTCKTDKCSYIIKNEDETDTNLFINDEYAFINDGEKYYLYDVSKGWEITKYEDVIVVDKEQNYFIIKYKGKFGLVQINPNVVTVLPSNYEEISFIKNLENKNIYDKFIVKENEIYKVLNSSKEELLSFDSSIIKEGNELFLITNDDFGNYVIDYEGKDLFESKIISDYSLNEDIFILYDGFTSFVYKLNKESEEVFSLLSEYTGKVTANKKEESLEIYLDDVIIDEIYLNSVESSEEL